MIDLGSYGIHDSQLKLVLTAHGVSLLGEHDLLHEGAEKVSGEIMVYKTEFLLPAVNVLTTSLQHQENLTSRTVAIPEISYQIVYL